MVYPKSCCPISCSDSDPPIQNRVPSKRQTPVKKSSRPSQVLTAPNSAPTRLQEDRGSPSQPLLGSGKRTGRFQIPFSMQPFSFKSPYVPKSLFQTQRTCYPSPSSLPMSPHKAGRRDQLGNRGTGARRGGAEYNSNGPFRECIILVCHSRGNFHFHSFQGSESF